MTDVISPNDPKQLRVLKKLTNFLELTSGFEGIKVYRGKTVVTAKELENCLSILEAPRPLVGAPAGHLGHKRLETWTLLLQGWPTDDVDHPSDSAYALKAACEQHLYKIIAVEEHSGLPLYKEHYLLGGDISALTIGQGLVRPPTEEAASRLAMFFLPLIVEIVTDVSNPYGK